MKRGCHCPAPLAACLLSVGKCNKWLAPFFQPHLYGRETKSRVPAHPSQLTQGLEYNALKNDQVLGLLQVGLRLRGQAHYSLGALHP